ncbi:MAG TPA: ornithine carbamoyltransferase [Chloroflexota bacterium]|nr:ornithine carbamoyltransferase [Chloroflexota bacterium]
MKRHLIRIADLTPDDIREIVTLARRLKAERGSREGRMLLAGRSLAMVFEKPSLRTRVSFELAMVELGGRALYLSPDEVQLGKREPVEDIARVLSRYVDCIVARVFSHLDVEILAKFASVPVINGLSDHDHPCQALADVMTICERFPSLDGVTLAYVGDGNNVFHSLVEAAVTLGIHVRAAFPPGYACDSAVLVAARERANASGSSVTIVESPQEAVDGADIVYTDVWTSMGQESEREARLRAFAGFQVNTQLLSRANPDAVVMHDLPAHRGEEITAEVIDGPRSVVFDQAENRLHAQKAVLLVLMR